jgi:hypothetical protein
VPDVDLKSEIIAYKAERDLEQRRAVQRVALLCNAGIDLDHLAKTGEAGRRLIVKRLRRLLERERIRGAMRHWSYDLNRHIALKQALDEFCPDEIQARKTKPAPVRRRFRSVSR